VRPDDGLEMPIYMKMRTQEHRVRGIGLATTAGLIALALFTHSALKARSATPLPQDFPVYPGAIEMSRADIQSGTKILSYGYWISSERLNNIADFYSRSLAPRFNVTNLTNSDTLIEISFLDTKGQLGNGRIDISTAAKERGTSQIVVYLGIEPRVMRLLRQTSPSEQLVAAWPHSLPESLVPRLPEVAVDQGEVSSSGYSQSWTVTAHASRPAKEVSDAYVAALHDIGMEVSLTDDRGQTSLVFRGGAGAGAIHISSSADSQGSEIIIFAVSFPM